MELLCACCHAAEKQMMSRVWGAPSLLLLLNIITVS